MPPALANALCKAAGVQLDTLPITFESLWNAVTAKETRRENVTIRF
jgi:CO/xanthine dehydrogenase Mo-binding subunit